jgi:hypothetical protein
VNPQQIEAMFTQRSGAYAFARWGRPVAPVVFGVQDEALGVIKGALEAVMRVAGHETCEMDPEFGSNLMVFFVRDWDELLGVRDLDRLIPDLVPLVARLRGGSANQYRLFRFDKFGAIKACFVFVCMDAQMLEMPGETLALSQMLQVALVWSDAAFCELSPLVRLPNGAEVLRAEIAEVIRAAYDPVMPAASQDPSHALRLFARLGEVS